MKGQKVPGSIRSLGAGSIFIDKPTIGRLKLLAGDGTIASKIRELVVKALKDERGSISWGLPGLEQPRNTISSVKTDTMSILEIVKTLLDNTPIGQEPENKNQGELELE